MYDTKASEPVGDPLRSEHRIERAEISPDGRLVLIAGVGGARVWDAATAKVVVGPVAENGKRVVDARFSPDGSRFVTFGRHERAARVWDLAGRAVATLDHGDDGLASFAMAPAKAVS